uniref:Uridine diphosphate glucose pyrophosphatase NUDT14 n=1 Tax=Cacopsylla melanoneura TaxID=428564 RepID=A0A8D9DUW4_9HEMI
MENLSDVQIVETKSSNFIRPYSVKFVQNGKARVWDCIKVHNSVLIVIYNVSRNVLVLVKQFRPAVYVNSIPEKDRVGTLDTTKYPPSLGVTLEFCAGIVDKKKSLAEIAREEVLEECGYDVPLEKMQEIQTFRGGVGSAGDRQTLFYVEVTDDMKLTSGGGVDEEMIEVVEMNLDEARQYLVQDDVPSPGGFLFALFWFLSNKVNK